MRIFTDSSIEEMEREIRRDQRILRILKTYAHVFRSRGIATSVDDEEVSFSCATSEKAIWAASKLGFSLKFVYIGAQPAKRAVVKDGDIEFHFIANDTRVVRITDCHVKRQRRQAGMARDARLFFHEKEIAKMMYLPGDDTPAELKQRLWEIAKKGMVADLRYELVD